MRKIYVAILCAAIGLVGCANFHESQSIVPSYSSSAQTSQSGMPADPDDAHDATISAGEEQQEKTDNQDSPKLALMTPIIFSEYEFLDNFPKHTGKTLVLELLDGSYDRSMYTWNRVWSGNFQFRLTDTHQPFEPFPDQETEDIISLPISLSFNDPFALTVDDYNCDGKPDFAISQYGSMTGGDYCAIFTLNDDGTVEILPINAGSERYISMFGTINEASDSSAQWSETFLLPYLHTDPSPLLTKNDLNGFSVAYQAIHGLEIASLFDESVLQSWFEEHSTTPGVRDVYQWRDAAFILIRQEILEDDGTVWKSSSKDFTDKNN